MAHIFGEITEPESRAFWDDEELEASQFQYTLRWIGDHTIPSTIQTLLIIEGSVATDLTKSCSIGNTKEVCVIEHGRYKPSLIYKINDGLYTCLVSQDLDARHATEFTQTIMDLLLIAKNIIAITCQHVSSHKSDYVPDSPSFLRSLHTKNCKLFVNEIESIKQPNILSGIVAAVISYAEILGLSAVTYVLYVEEFSLDSETASPLIKLYSKINDSLLSHKPVFKQSSFSSRGNLYM